MISITGTPIAAFECGPFDVTRMRANFEISVRKDDEGEPHRVDFVD